MLRRMIGAATLNVNVYEEVEADRSATLPALLVVLLVSLATGIGSLSSGGVSGLIGGIIFGIVIWGLWALITFVIGTTLFRTPETEADWGQLLRTLGFAQSPGGVTGVRVHSGDWPVHLLCYGCLAASDHGGGREASLGLPLHLEGNWGSRRGLRSIRNHLSGAGENVLSAVIPAQAAWSLAKADSPFCAG